MIINSKGNIEIYNGDYGMPITFETDGFSVDDEVVFAVSGDAIPPKTFTVDSADYSFELSFSEQEAQAIAKAASCAPICFSFKQYRDGAFLDTIADGKIEVKGTVTWVR